MKIGEFSGEFSRVYGGFNKEKLEILEDFGEFSEIPENCTTLGFTVLDDIQQLLGVEFNISYSLCLDSHKMQFRVNHTESCEKVLIARKTEEVSNDIKCKLVSLNYNNNTFLGGLHLSKKEDSQVVAKVKTYYPPHKAMEQKQQETKAAKVAEFPWAKCKAKEANLMLPSSPSMNMKCKEEEQEQTLRQLAPGVVTQGTSSKSRKSAHKCHKEDQHEEVEENRGELLAAIMQCKALPGDKTA
uniref:Uncharacterized protein n=1 Tax=Ditylenchus dipsaci TaxID=166011 RepID=A0A915EIF5_9BILA